MKPPPWLIPLSLLSLSLLAYSGMVSMQFRHGELGGRVVVEFLYWYGLAFVGYIGAILWVERWGDKESPPSPCSLYERSKAFGLGWLWGGGCLFRFLFLFTSPSLSSDVYRYLWDGHVAVNGISPYAFPIDAPELDGLDIPIRALANHAWLASPYMPVAQWFFAGVAFLFPLKPISIQVAVVVFDLTTALLIAQLLALARLPGHRLLIYLWNPLVIVEVAHGAHVDAWMVVLMMAAVLGIGYWKSDQDVRIDRKMQDISCLDSCQSNTLDSDVEGRGAPRQLMDAPFARFDDARRLLAALSPALLALATLTKLIPVLLTPIFWWQWNWGRRLLYGALSVGLLLPSAMRAGWGLTGDLDGRGLFGALRIYEEYWKFNSGLFHWLEMWLREAGVADSQDVTQEIALSILVALLLWAWLCSRRDRNDLRATLRWLAAPLAGYVLLTMTFHPWYLLALLPFVPLLTPGADELRRIWLWTWPWLWLSGTLALSYIRYIDPTDPREFEWVRRWEWLPTLGLLGIALAVTKWPLNCSGRWKGSGF